MPRDQRDSPGEVGALVAGTARVKTIACLGGVSLERNVPPGEIPEYLGAPENVVWVDVQDPGPAEQAMLIDVFGLHPHALEDATRGQRRPKLDDFKGHVLLVTHAAVPAARAQEPRTAEVDLFVGRNFLVTIHRGHVPAIEEARTRWTRGGPLLREGAGYLLYKVLDTLIDSFEPLITDIEDGINEAEAAVMLRSEEEDVRSLLRLKRDLATLRRVLHPLGSVFQVLLRRDQALFPGNAEVYLRDVFEHVLRILDVLETERDMAAGALDASLAISANRLNKTMKTLAVITVAVAVVGSVFGAYGMNFQWMPLATAPWGFWAIAFGTIAAVTVALLAGWRLGWW